MSETMEATPLTVDNILNGRTVADKYDAPAVIEQLNVLHDQSVAYPDMAATISSKVQATIATQIGNNDFYGLHIIERTKNTALMDSAVQGAAAGMAILLDKGELDAFRLVMFVMGDHLELADQLEQSGIFFAEADLPPGARPEPQYFSGSQSQSGTWRPYMCVLRVAEDGGIRLYDRLSEGAAIEEIFNPRDHYRDANTTRSFYNVSNNVTMPDTSYAVQREPAEIALLLERASQSPHISKEARANLAQARDAIPPRMQYMRNQQPERAMLSQRRQMAAIVRPDC